MKDPIGIGGAATDDESCFIFYERAFEGKLAGKGADACAAGKLFAVSVPGRDIEYGGKAAAVFFRDRTFI